MRLVQAWIELHRDELMADWDLAVSGENPTRSPLCRPAMYWDAKFVKPFSDFCRE
ncbi:MAG: DUF4160 domain-containing protein [Betaproteobacteria bacterium]|nr:DUF4160 domain-containing protein [Betaproteobacteria bacterium]